MTTTTTLTTTAATSAQAPGQLPAPPEFTRQAPGETTAEYGRRAFWYALQLTDGASFAKLDDAALDAAADEITGAVTQRDISQTTLACLQQLQARLRRSQTARAEWRAERDRQLQALFEAAGAGSPAPGQTQAAAPIDAQAGSPGSQDGSQGQSGGGGGSKVPKAPRPTPRPSPGGLQAMDETGAGAFRPVPALALDALDAF